MHPLLEAICQRRAIRVFDRVAISPALRDELLHAALFASCRFKSQLYRLFWVESPTSRREVATLCSGQPPAQTDPTLLIAVADLGCWRSTSPAQFAWMRATGFSPEKISEYERKSKFARWFYIPGWCNLLGAFKWIVFRAVYVFKISGVPPVTRQGLFK